MHLNTHTVNKIFLTRLNRTKILRFLGFFLIFLLLTGEVWARAGGGGGDYGGSGGGSGDGDIVNIIFHLMMLLPFPYNIIVIGIILVLVFYSRKKVKQQSVINKLPSPTNFNVKTRNFSAFVSRNPDFNQEAFKQKVATAFIQVQKAWSAKDISGVRKYISDGVYQRFNTQFKMMNLLEQTNVLEDIQIKSIQIDRAEIDGNYDVLHVAVYASVRDKFISKKYPEFNSGGYEEFVEYWSFIKKNGVEGKDLYSTNNCPNCGAELPPNAGELSRCPFCKTITNLGDYDWVLAEITQADDYIYSNTRVSKTANLHQNIHQILASDSDFSVQLIEDKASNAFLQIHTAFVLQDPKIMRRFVSDTLYEKLCKMIPQNQVVYNRLFLNDVTLITAAQKDDTHLLMVAVKASYQRIMPTERSAVKVDPAMVSRTEIIYLQRKIGASKPQGSLYAHDCPKCGAPLGDTIDTSCSYCGATLNSPEHEWIIADIQDVANYNFYAKQYADTVIAGVNPEKIDDLLDIRDYAFNNVLIMIAADGVFEQAEMDFAYKLAKKLGYSVSKVQPMVDMAKSQRLVLRMPQQAKQQTKVYKLMLKAAKIDNNLAKQESDLLESIKTNYSINLE